MVNLRSQPDDFISLLYRRARGASDALPAGFRPSDVARELGIAPRTVERHVENLRKATAARNKPHLVAKALSGGQHLGRSLCLFPFPPALLWTTSGPQPTE